MPAENLLLQKFKLSEMMLNPLPMDNKESH